MSMTPEVVRCWCARGRFGRRRRVFVWRREQVSDDLNGVRTDVWHVQPPDGLRQPYRLLNIRWNGDTSERHIQSWQAL